MESEKKISALIEKGVKIPSPGSIEIGDEVMPDRISGHGVVINPGCRLKGTGIFIGNNTIIGSEGPVMLENVQTAASVSLGSGYAKNTVFLAGSSAGSNFHVREGCIFEEQSSCAHTAGLKQTVLFPFATLGSLVNLCDCMMTGGTGRKDHSEVGSSYIHFNYTPNQDKATPSIMGNVPEGVMLDRPPVFLGGQGGMVGPCRIAFGTVIAAGSICRKDILKENRLVSEVHGRNINIPASPGFYRQIKRIVCNNLFYMANLVALSVWYRNARMLFIDDSKYPLAVHNGVLENLDMALVERQKRFLEFCEKMPFSIENYIASAGDNASGELVKQKRELYLRREDVLGVIIDLSAGDFDCPEKDCFLMDVSRGISENGRNYLMVVQSLSPGAKQAGREWLWKAVNSVCSRAFEKLPVFGLDGYRSGEK